MSAEELQPARAVHQDNVGLHADLLATLVAASVKPGGADCRDKATPPYFRPLWHGQERAIGAYRSRASAFTSSTSRRSTKSASIAFRRSLSACSSAIRA